MSEIETNDAQHVPSDEAKPAESQAHERNTLPSGGQSDHLTGLRMYSIVSAVLLSTLLIGLDISIVATAAPTISDHFHSTAEISWYGSAYLLALCALQPLAGKFYTSFPVKNTFMTFFGVFEAGNVICALAPSSAAVIAGRTVTGMGAAGIMNGALVIVTVCCAPAVRTFVMAFAISMISIGGIVGPVVSGTLVQHAGWRWCFWIFLPPGALTIGIIFLLRIPEQMVKPPIRGTLPQLPIKLDLPGFALFAPTCTMFLLAINWGGTTHPWHSPLIIGLLVGSATTLSLFILWSHHAQDSALLPPRLLKSSSLLCGCLVSFLQGGATNLLAFYLPEWFQSVKGAQPQKAGLMLLPTMISQIIGTGLAGGLVRRLHYIPPWAIAGSLLTALGAGLMSSFTVHTHEGLWIGYQVISGLGRGAALPIPIIAAQSFLPKSDIALASAALALCQYLGGAVFISIAQAVFQNAFGPALARYAPGVDLDVVLKAGATGFRDEGVLEDEGQVEGVVRAWNAALVRLFVIPAVGAGLAMVCGFGLGWGRVGAEKKGGEAEEEEERQGERGW